MSYTRHFNSYMRRISRGMFCAVCILSGINAVGQKEAILKLDSSATLISQMKMDSAYAMNRIFKDPNTIKYIIKKASDDQWILLKYRSERFSILLSSCLGDHNKRYCLILYYKGELHIVTDNLNWNKDKAALDKMFTETGFTDKHIIDDINQHVSPYINSNKVPSENF